MGFSLPLSPTETQTEELPHVLTLLGPHQHKWAFMQQSPYYWFGTRWGGCAVGGARASNSVALHLFENVPAFRQAIEREVVAGSLDRVTTVAAILHGQDHSAPEATRRLHDKLVEKYGALP